jgi:hypothetical protein
MQPPWTSIFAPSQQHCDSIVFKSLAAPAAGGLGVFTGSGARAVTESAVTVHRRDNRDRDH